MLEAANRAGNPTARSLKGAQTMAWSLTKPNPNMRRDVTLKEVAPFSILSIATLIVLCIIGETAHAWPLGWVLAVWFTLTLPIWFSLSYNSYIFRSLHLVVVKKQKIAHKIFLGLACRLIFTGVFAFVFATTVLSNLLTFQVIDYIMLVLTVSLFGFCYFFTDVTKDPLELMFKQYIARNSAIMVSILFTVPVPFLVQGYIYDLSVIETTPLHELADLEFESQLIEALFWISAETEHIDTLAFNTFGSFSFGFKVLITIPGLALSVLTMFGFLTIFSIFLRPLKEFKWAIQSPPNPGEDEKKLSFMRLAIVSFVAVAAILILVALGIKSSERGIAESADQRSTFTFVKGSTGYTLKNSKIEKIQNDGA